MKTELHEPWHIEGGPGEYWVALVRKDGYLVASPIRRSEALAIVRWQRAYRAAGLERRARLQEARRAARSGPADEVIR